MVGAERAAAAESVAAAERAAVAERAAEAERVAEAERRQLRGRRRNCEERCPGAGGNGNDKGSDDVDYCLVQASCVHVMHPYRTTRRAQGGSVGRRDMERAGRRDYEDGRVTCKP